MIKIDEEVKEILRKVNEVAEEEIIKVGDTIKFKDANYYKSLGYTQDKHKYFFNNANAEKVVTKVTYDNDLRLVYVNKDTIPLTDADYDKVESIKSDNTINTNEEDTQLPFDKEVQEVYKLAKDPVNCDEDNSADLAIREFLEQVAEKADINFKSVGKNGKTGFYIEFEYWSDLGEDVIITLVVDELTKDEILYAMYIFEENFDAEEHAAELFNLRGKYGTPTSLRALLKDADEQAEKLKEIYDIMKNI